ncbi:MAG: class I SAM-dependent methyltransferase [Chitinophagaceae bacterium]
MSTNNNWTGERLEPGVFTETSIEHLHRYAIAMEFAAGKKVLDIACGEGYGSKLLSKIADHVTGVDINADIINDAKEKYQSKNLQFLTGTVEDIPAADGQFDIVVSFETIEHTTGHEKMISEIKRVLKPEGLLIISTPDKKNYSDKTGYKNPFHTKELYIEEFSGLLHRYFKNVQLLSQQITLSSVITADKASGLKMYTGDYSNIQNDNAENRLYSIALASDAVLPSVNNSLFNGRSVFAEAVSQKEKVVTNTLSYKLGHVILYPAKLLRKLFKK